MSIPRYNHTVERMEHSPEGVYVHFEYYLEDMEELEYSLRYEREQKEEAEQERETLRHEMEYYKKLVQENLDISGIGC